MSIQLKSMQRGVRNRKLGEEEGGVEEKSPVGARSPFECGENCISPRYTSRTRALSKEKRGFNKKFKSELVRLRGRQIPGLRDRKELEGKGCRPRRFERKRGRTSFSPRVEYRIMLLATGEKSLHDDKRFP